MLPTIKIVGYGNYDAVLAVVGTHFSPRRVSASGPCGSLGLGPHSAEPESETLRGR